MKYLLYTLTLLLIAAGSVQAQKTPLQSPRQQIPGSFSNQENFKVTFTKSNYGITFQRGDRTLDSDMESRIRKFMKDNSLGRPKYQGNGTFTLHIIKRGGKYYVVDQEQPERLLPLQ